MWKWFHFTCCCRCRTQAGPLVEVWLQVWLWNSWPVRPTHSWCCLYASDSSACPAPCCQSFSPFYSKLHPDELVPVKTEREPRPIKWRRCVINQEAILDISLTSSFGHLKVSSHLCCLSSNFLRLVDVGERAEAAVHGGLRCVHHLSLQLLLFPLRRAQWTLIRIIIIKVKASTRPCALLFIGKRVGGFGIGRHPEIESNTGTQSWVLSNYIQTYYILPSQRINYYLFEVLPLNGIAFPIVQFNYYTTISQYFLVFVAIIIMSKYP